MFTKDLKIVESSGGEFFVTRTFEHKQGEYLTHIYDRTGDKCGTVDFVRKNHKTKNNFEIKIVKIMNSEKRGSGRGTVLMSSALEFLRGIKAEIVELSANTGVMITEINEQIGLVTNLGKIFKYLKENVGVEDLEEYLTQKLIPFYERQGFNPVSEVVKDRKHKTYSCEMRIDLRKIKDHKFLVRGERPDEHGDMHRVYRANPMEI